MKLKCIMEIIGVKILLREKNANIDEFNTWKGKWKNFKYKRRRNDLTIFATCTNWRGKRG